MKTRTLKVIKKYMDEGKIYFPDHINTCILSLTKGEIRAIIRMEYGISPKKDRILRKRLKILIDDLLRYLLKDLDDKIEP